MQYVPDGDPCPTHGQPTRLGHLPGLGLYSQCPGCVEDFFAWLSEHARTFPERRAEAAAAVAPAKGRKPAAMPPAPSASAPSTARAQLSLL